MKSISLPANITDAMSALSEIVRRAVDGTVSPLFVDESNQRVLIGAVAVSGSNVGKLEVTGGDIKVVDNAKGIVLNDANGTAYRLYMDTDGAIRADKL